MTTGIDYGQFEEGRHVNYWELDDVLQFELRRIYDDAEFEWGRERLSSFGEAVGHTIADNADVIDNHGPELHTYDKHGEVVNETEYHPAQFDNEQLVREHGTIADSFHAPPGRDERMPHSHSVAMEHLLSYADTGLGCPTGMTAAAALVLEQFDDDGEFEACFEGATAREYEASLSAGMFLTEKQGGSDVGATETIAEQADDGTWRLTGEKWFCSNLDGDFIFTLARPPDAPDGTKGLGMFLVPRETRPGERNDYYFRRLKDKLGTISVPTGEVEFDETEAYLLGDVEEGFSYMAVMLNRSRLAVAAWCLGIIGRSLLESKIHAANREAFGEPLVEKPLMREDLVDMAVEYEAATAFTYEAAQWFDRWDREEDNETAYRLMRPLLSTAKYRTGRLGIDAASYATEIQGGNGYINGFVTERLFRDAQVHPIWEGTTNMLALDVVRTAENEAAHGPLVKLIDERLDGVDHPALLSLRDDVASALTGLDESFETVLAADREYAELNAKRLTDYLFDVTTAALLLDEAQWEIDNESNARKAVVAHRFIAEHLRAHSNRGITEEGRLSDEQFDAIVRFASIPLETIGDSVEPAR